MYAGMSLWMGQPATHGAALTHMPPKMEWKRFSANNASHVLPPLRRQSKVLSGLR